MIVFIAAFPSLSDEKEGMAQRIASIDALVNDLPRVYLDISFRRFWSKRVHRFGEAKVFQLNGLVHFFIIVSWLKKATTVYVHSVYNSFKVIPAYWVATPITDLHGVYPEELVYEGKRGHACLYGWAEQIALRRSAAVIYVTSAMKRHFQRKYGRQSSADCTIPILPKLSDVRGQRKDVLAATRDCKLVIYAGGVQAYQNVPMMLEAAAAAPQLRFVFLSGEAATLQRLAYSASVANFACASVAPNQVADHYLTSTYGFVLRDPVLLNHVACPTKLVEYLYWGVIPVVLTPKIGDFLELGYAFVSLEDFRAGRMPDGDEAARMRAINRQVAEKLIESCEGALSTLRQVLRYGANHTLPSVIAHRRP
jgi:glycosyltransferase involved in cell wall biosynthesis